jgi:hypothetical protein
MPTPIWQGGTLYPTGSLVQPASAAPPVNTEITNAGFESGDIGWTKGSGWTINASGAYQGSWAAQYSFTGTSDLLNDTFNTVTPGQSITASCMVQQGASSAGQAGARIILSWYTSADVLISTSLGTEVNTGSGGAWGQSTITATAPATAAKVKVGARAFRTSGTNPLWVDVFVWNYLGPATPAGLIYRAVQPTTGTSAEEEPVWPLVLGVQVNDGTVIWEAVAATRVTWQANAIFLSGSVEPTWPLVPGEFVLDGSFQWQAVNRYVEDENCPNTKVVAILASHVFAADDDITKFSAVNNALDWTTQRDAGYLPTGLQQANANEMAVLAPYRANLAALNASSFQLWQADPDPAAMVILDQQDGIGSIWPRAAVSVAGELYYLAALGVRTIGQSAGNNSLSAGDVGMPVDDIVQEALAQTVTAERQPFASYYPSLGQVIFVFPYIVLAVAGDTPAGYVGAAYSFTYDAVGGASPYTFSVSAGALPAGVTLSSDGVLSGTPATAGTYPFTVLVTDANGSTVSFPTSVQVGQFQPPTLVTNTDSFDGTPAALTVGESFGLSGTTNRVRVTSDGIYAAFARTGTTGADRFGWKKWNIGTGAWDVLPNPADMPTKGPVGLSWSNSDRFLFAGIAETSPNNLVMYERVGDTLTKVAQSVGIPNLGHFTAWSRDDSMVAVGNGNSAAGIYVFDVEDGVLSNPRTVNTGTGNMRPAFSPDGAHIASGGTGVTGLWVISISPGSLAIVDSDASANAVCYAGVHWTDEGIVTVAGDGAGPNFVNAWTFDGSTLTHAGAADTQPGTMADSNVTDDGLYLVAARGSGSSVYVYDLTNFSAPALVETQAVAGTVSTCAWGIPVIPSASADVVRKCDAFVVTRNAGSKSGSWSRYRFPFEITDFALLGNDLYFRQGDTISKFDKSVAYDELTVGGTQVPFGGRVQWNWLDCGQPGTTKQMHGFDFIGTGSPSFSVGYDERNKDRFTTAYAIDADTLPGGIIPLPVVAPSMSFRVDFTAGTAWTVKSVLLYVDDLGNGP